MSLPHSKIKERPYNAQIEEALNNKIFIDQQQMHVYNYIKGSKPSKFHDDFIGIVSSVILFLFFKFLGNFSFFLNSVLFCQVKATFSTIFGLISTFLIIICLYCKL